jgi:hypothetical protein
MLIYLQVFYATEEMDIAQAKEWSSLDEKLKQLKTLRRCVVAANIIEGLSILSTYYFKQDLSDDTT